MTDSGAKHKTYEVYPLYHYLTPITLIVSEGQQAGAALRRDSRNVNCSQWGVVIGQGG